MRPSFLENVISALGAILCVALFGYLLLIGLTVEARVAGQQSITVMDLHAPRPQQHPRHHIVPPKTKRMPDRASPRNLKNKATAIVARPRMAGMPIPSPIVATKAGLGMAPSAGASDRPGAGEGAGGEGSGSGGGGDGDTPPRQIRGRLKFSDLPAALRDSATGGTVSVRYDVAIDGTVGDCAIMVSSGSAELDQLTCRLIRQRFRFDPSRDGDGRPVPSTIEEEHSWEFEKKPDLPHP